jgi:hypothetical protein
MVKKVTRTMKVNLAKNTLTEKGGAWLLSISILDENSNYVYDKTTAWSNPSAAKRWVKHVVQTETPRKSIKLEVTATDNNGKPTVIAGEAVYKQEVV